MLFEIDIDEVPARIAEVMATIAAGHGVIFLRGGEAVARLVPEAAFAPAEEDPDAGLSAEEREAREVMAMFEATMNDSF
jgi:antitoxin (DNA-binding transcriptional repressor) of toxin-antitoxin stability system